MTEHFILFKGYCRIPKSTKNLPKFTETYLVNVSKSTESYRNLKSSVNCIPHIPAASLFSRSGKISGQRRCTPTRNELSNKGARFMGLGNKLLAN